MIGQVGLLVIVACILGATTLLAFGYLFWAYLTMPVDVGPEEDMYDDGGAF